MMDDARKGEYPLPEFADFEDGMLVKFDKKIFNKEQQIPDISEIKYADKVLKLIRENPIITIKKMAQELSMSDRNMKRILIELVDAKIIDRIGSKRSGIWLIIGDNTENDNK
jgi:ATP-dependent DNA helicase RecG